MKTLLLAILFAPVTAIANTGQPVRNMSTPGVETCSGKMPNSKCVQKFGENTDVDGEEWLWPLGTMIFRPDPAGEVHHIYSDSTDDYTGGIGCRSVTIDGVDQNWATAIETVNISSGDINTITATTFAGINSVTCATAGTSTTTVGNVYAYAAGGSTSAYAPAGYGRTQQAFYFVPSTHTLYISSFYADALKDGGSAAGAILEGRVITGANTTTPVDFQGRSFEVTSRSPGVFPVIEPPFAVPGGSVAYFKIRSVTSANLQVMGGFSGYLKRN